MKDYKETARAVILRRDEYLKEKKRKQRMALGITASALCLFLAVATPFAVMKMSQNNEQIPNSLPETVYPQNNDETASVETGEKPKETPSGESENIIFPGFDASDSKTENMEVTNDVLYTPEEGKTVYVSQLLSDTLNNMADNEWVAFTVNIYGDGVNKADDLSELSDRISAKEEELSNVANAEIERLMDMCSISHAEASARKFSEGEFPLVRAEVLQMSREYAESWASSYYKNNAELIDALSEYGFKILYTGENAEYAVYLEKMHALGVAVGTKAQIEEFINSEHSLIYFLCGAEKNANLMNPTDFYSGSEVYLEDGSGLSAAVKEQFSALGDSEKLKVKVVYAYFGDEYQTKEELGQAALDAIGLDMTFYEWYNSNDDELYDKYLDKYMEAKNRIIYHKDFNEQVAGELLCDGELVEIRDWANCFIAELTYERALEVAQSEDVAYIDTEVNIYLTQYAIDDVIYGELE